MVLYTLSCTNSPFSNSLSFTFAAVQIFFVPERAHWVATSYLHGEVLLYDSLFNGKLSASLEEQIVRVYRPAVADGGLLVTAVPVQQQTGGTDCGLFSIAFSYHAAIGDDLTLSAPTYCVGGPIPYD